MASKREEIELPKVELPPEFANLEKVMLEHIEEFEVLNKENSQKKITITKKTKEIKALKTLVSKQDTEIKAEKTKISQLLSENEELKGVVKKVEAFKKAFNELF